MSNAGAQPLPLPPDTRDAAPAPRSSASRRSYLARTALDTLGRTGAKLGVAWIGFVALCAVFAPFIANSHPFLKKMDGRWSSPLVEHLTAADVTLLVAFFAAVVLALLRGIAGKTRVWAFFGIVAVTAAAAWLFVTPPKAVVFSQHREDMQAGRVEFILHAPIPYSPSDRLRDQSDPSRPHPWPPSAGHPLGTEKYGGDILSRMIHASRVALAVGFIAQGIAVRIGVSIGGLMGYFAGPVDLFGMRLVEIFSS